jgi:hypothetical protein
MTYRTCSAIACTARVSMGAAFCNHHWPMIPSQMQMNIAGLAARARTGQADAVQNRLLYALLLARQTVSKLEKRGSQPIAPAIKAKAEQEDKEERERLAA